jgi:hypothetical protein
MRTTLIACVAAIAAMACSTTPAARTTSAPAPAGAVRHIVVFRYKPDASPEKIQQVTEALTALKD